MTDKCKILMLGDGGVGKSSLLNRYVDNKFSENIQATLGVEYRQKIIVNNNKQLTVQVWDTAGQERFRVITPIYFRNAEGVALVFSVIDKNTFDQVQNWIENLKQHSSYDTVSIVLVANKCDDPNMKREVQCREGEQLAKDQSIKYYECSAKTGQNVNEMFSELVNQILQKRTEKNKAEKDHQESKRIVDLNQEPQDQKCC